MVEKQPATEATEGPLQERSLGYPDPSKIVRGWAIGFGGNVHSGMLLTHNCLPANASLVDFSITYQAVP